MNKTIIERQFAKIGARAEIHAAPRRNFGNPVSIDIARDKAGEFFDITVTRDSALELNVLDTQPKIRHLLLMTREDNEKHKFLCGHDERHWFVAAVPELAAASNVKTAFEALKPWDVKRELTRRKVKRKNRNRRRNEAFIRQGEWFFVPVGSGFQFDKRMIFRNEPIRRGRGKPHHCEELIRTGGEAVYVNHQYPNGVTELHYRELLRHNTKLRGPQWSVQRRNPDVFVRGKIRHADHKTIVLHGWHQVLMNTETQSAAMRHVAFLD